jgi:L-asparaginase II
MGNPVGVEVWRGGRVESRHRVSVCVADATGGVVHAAGDIEQRVYPRSAVKPFQALALLETGAADAFAVSDEEIALACASHGGEPQHVERVGKWLERLGLDDTCLACGPHPPSYAPAAAVLVREGRPARRIHNNCSGKHTGMLAAALRLGAPTVGYELPDHPVQRHVMAALAAVTATADLGEPGIDGCSLPVFAIPLKGLARAAASLADTSHLAPQRRAATERIVRAMQAHPNLVAGTGRCCTALMQALPDVVAKTGAEGVYIAGLRKQGLGIAIKVDDGAGRGAEPAILAVIAALGGMGESGRQALDPFLAPRLINYAGIAVGRIGVAPGWPPFATA